MATLRFMPIFSPVLFDSLFHKQANAEHAILHAQTLRDLEREPHFVKMSKTEILCVCPFWKLVGCDALQHEMETTRQQLLSIVQQRIRFHSCMSQKDQVEHEQLWSLLLHAELQDTLDNSVHHLRGDLDTIDVVHDLWLSWTPQWKGSVSQRRHYTVDNSKHGGANEGPSPVRFRLVRKFVLYASERDTPLTTP